MLKNKMILAVISVIIALGLAGCRAEKDNADSAAVNTESSITETVSDISETPADASSNKTAEITEKPESSAPTERSNKNTPTESIMQNNGEPKKPEKPKAQTEPETRKTENEKPPAPTESVSKPEEIQKPSESSEPVKSGLKRDRQAKYCWDNPIAAGKTCKYTERDIKWYIDRYARLPEITAVWIWAEENGKDYEIYIGYA